MIIYPVCLSFTFFTLFVLVTTESNETLREAPLLRCAQVNKKARPRFHLVRRCARSDVRVVITANFSSLWRCSEFAMFKRGLAFNFGWLKGGIGHCEVLECPEYDTLGLLRRRDNYDYYSLYANPLPSMDWLCIPKVGVFRIGRGEARSASRRKCQEWALMPSPRNKTEGKTNSSSPGDQTGMASSAATARPESGSTQELQPSNSPSSPTVPSPTMPPAGLLPPQPVPPFPPSPPFGDNPFGPPFLSPDTFSGGLGEPPSWSPEYKLGELLNTSNATDVKPKEAGQLANVLSQDRTTNLTTFLSSKIGKFFPPVLTGLATLPGDEDLFVTSDGEPLPCFRFRAWAPGHPLPTKRLNLILQKRYSTPKPSTQVRTNVTAKANTTSTNSNSTQTAKNETVHNNGTMNITTAAAERKRDEMTLCVYIHRDSLWHTNLCSTKTLFLCELLPSGGPCRDANSTDERAACEFEKIGTNEDHCSAWNGEMITTMMPIGTEMGDEDKPNEDGNNSNEDNHGTEENNTGEDNSNTNEDNNNTNGDNDNTDEDSDNTDEDSDNTDEDNDNTDEDNDNTDKDNNNTDEDDGDYQDSSEPPENNETGNNGDEDDNNNYDYNYETNKQDNNYNRLSKPNAYGGGRVPVISDSSDEPV